MVRVDTLLCFLLHAGINLPHFLFPVNIFPIFFCCHIFTNFPDIFPASGLSACFPGFFRQAGAADVQQAGQACRTSASRKKLQAL